MRVFASPAPPITENQWRYLNSLLAARFDSLHDIPPELVGVVIPRDDMTIDEASRAIDVVKSIPSRWERQKAANLERRDRLVEHLLGIDGVDEEVVARRWDDILAWHFSIRREVTGEHFSGHRLRIDRLLSPAGWRWGCGHAHEVGFEIKTGRGSKNVTGQAADYANTRWQKAPGDGFVIVGIFRNDPEESRHLAAMGCFAFTIEPDWSTGDPELHLMWNGTRMWSGLTTGTTRRIPHKKWCPSRKFGSR